MYEEAATRILRKKDVGHSLPADKESGKHICGIVTTLAPPQLLQGQGYHCSAKRINLAASASEGLNLKRGERLYVERVLAPH